MSDFEKELMQSVEKIVLKKIAEGNWIGIPSAISYDGKGSRVEVSRQFLSALFARVDFQRVSDLVLTKVEEKIADKIYNSIVTEIGNDTKLLMCDQKAREHFRLQIRERIGAVCEVQPK